MGKIDDEARLLRDRVFTEVNYMNFVKYNDRRVRRLIALKSIININIWTPIKGVHFIENKI